MQVLVVRIEPLRTPIQFVVLPQGFAGSSGQLLFLLQPLLLGFGLRGQLAVLHRIQLVFIHFLQVLQLLQALLLFGGETSLFVGFLLQVGNVSVA